MIKSTKMLKRLGATFLVVLMSIESFAAVVGDNDGAAFITKAEFDSMKNDFQSQLDRYNSSLDNKIDGAIASYLSGIKVQKEMRINPLVANYQDIRWQDSLKLYGYWKKWTDVTTLTSGTNEWFTPMSDRRMNIRWAKFDIWDNFGVDFGNGMIAIRSEVKKLGPGVCYQSAGTSDCTAPVLYWKAVKRDDRLFLRLDAATDTEVFNGQNQDTLLNNLWLTNPELWSVPHKPIPTGKQAWEFTNSGYAIQYRPGTIVFNSPGDGELLNYNIGVTTWPAYSDWNSTWNMIIGGQGSQICAVFDAYSIDDAIDRFVTRTNCLYETTKQLGMQDASMFPSGVSWQAVIPANWPAVKESIKYLMLGARDENKLNYHETSGLITINNRLGFNYVDTSYVKLAPNHLNITTGMYTPTQNTDKYVAVSGISDVELRIPLFPQAKVCDFYTPIFSANNQALKLGQGIPILLNSSVTGYVTLNFDFDVFYTLDGTRRDKDIYVDIKKTDFMNTTTDYCGGYKGIVDPDNTTSSLITLNRVAFNHSDTNPGKVSLTIPVKKDESIWMRICPQDTSGGVYAKMSNFVASSFSQ